MLMLGFLLGFFVCFVWGASNSGSWHMVSTWVYVHVYYRATLIGWSEILGVDLLSREALGSVVLGGTAFSFWLWQRAQCGDLLSGLTSLVALKS